MTLNASTAVLLVHLALSHFVGETDEVTIHKYKKVVLISENCKVRSIVKTSYTFRNTVMDSGTS